MTMKNTNSRLSVEYTSQVRLYVSRLAIRRFRRRERTPTAAVCNAAKHISGHSFVPSFICFSA
ncbi:Uncharacterized protein APZ42_001610 [Daphnia magna]|uniref:Uncharacterized protein n=1 Tax=Daphnia magna TaxID=35525 RepID=A0A0P5MU73_9CRUS|nr:Uncharacterized protein APZ42_001610 [Daphnia magna]